METYQDLEFFKDETPYLYDWIFHYNGYTKSWAAIPRDLYTQYWDKHDYPNVLKSSKLETLLELLHKSKGDIDVINKLMA
jgi:hypothetical protein